MNCPCCGSLNLLRHCGCTWSMIIDAMRRTRLRAAIEHECRERRKIMQRERVVLERKVGGT